MLFYCLRLKYAYNQSENQSDLPLLKESIFVFDYNIP